ncbi:hypothetical protein ACWD11_22715 [Streptomyces sp. NPDC002776]
MRIRTALAGALLVLAAATAGCSSDKSEEEIAVDCQQALADGATATKTERPEACEGLTQDDYDALLMSQALQDSGVVDDDGNVDVDELLDSDQ